jgi:hypothetical protein
MNTPCFAYNLTLAWTWICLGFASGLALGSGFHREQWLGGYGSLRRRLYRLGHISFFGLGVLNLLFCLTVRMLPGAGGLCHVAAWGFGLGALTMPVCCVLMAHWPQTRLLFAVPVLSLLGGGLAVLWEVATASKVLP